MTASSFVELLRKRAEAEGDRVAYHFLVDGEDQEVKVTYADIDRQARAIGALLQQHGFAGQRALLLYPPGIEYVAGYLGCLFAGVVAVPAYPPDPMRLNRTLPRLVSVANDAQTSVVLTTAQILSMSEMVFPMAPDLARMKWMSTDDVSPDLADGWKDPRVKADDLAFLQYTSGSTADPKGVMITHRNLIHNSGHIYRCFGNTADTIGVIWLPTYHDMGLIGGVLNPLYAGIPVWLMSPIAFLQRPIRWLRAITRARATASGGPNFAYDLCIRKITAEERETLDLSSWKVAFNGAEPIRPEVLDRFCETFEPCGFRREAFYPCYGLAEATLIVSGGLRDDPPVVHAIRAEALEENRIEPVSADDPAARRLVGCGRTLADQRLVIVDPESCVPLGPNQIGEIWVSGDSVARGYWGRGDATAQTFQARLAPGGEGPFLRTGDLGFLREDGELFVTGRLKDLIIIAGRNHYPQDIERTVERAHPSLRAGCSAAFSVVVGSEERLVVVAEVERRFAERRRSDTPVPSSPERRRTDRRVADVEPGRDPEKPAPFDSLVVQREIRRAVSEQHQLQVHAVVLLKAGSIPKTSSGKIQRHACRAAYLQQTLEVVE